MKIVIVDDDSLVALSLKTIVESDPEIIVEATGASGEEAIELYETYHPEVLLMDIRMRNTSGLEAGERILEKHPDAKILYLTTFSDDEYICKALSIGAKGYIIKQDFEAVVPSLKAVYQGQVVFGTEVMSKLPQILSGKEQKTDGKKEKSLEEYGLTEKEIEVAECVAEGLSNKEISAKLCLSEGTVRNYLSSVLGKLDLRDRTNLAIFVTVLHPRKK